MASTQLMSCDKLKPGKSTIFAVRQICNVTRNDFNVTLEDTSYHDCRISRCCNRCIFSLTTYEVLRHAALFLAAFVRYIIKHLFHEYLDSI